VLQDAVFRPVRATQAPIAPHSASLKEIEAGLHHGELIRFSGKVIDRSFRAGGVRKQGGHWTRKVLLLQHENLIFTAEAETSGNEPALEDIPVGSTIEITGVCFTETDEKKKLESLQLLMPTAASFRVLARPSWLTPQRLLIGVGALLVLLVLGAIWTLAVSKRNATLRQLVQDKEVAQDELQQAHDFLEERVKERTAQLKFQITARKESELQFKAVLSERTRLAQELHDTLEQTLTGIGLQLDASSKLMPANPDNATYHLDLAREMISQSQIDVRRSIWDLRSRALEQFDLPGALTTSTKQLADGSNIVVKVTTCGRVRPLPETIEENLLRIAQEAMTNVVKHSKASTALVELDFGPKTISLKISDNGIGFDPQDSPGPESGHFGLQGISERAKRIGGELLIQRGTEGGTTVSIRVAVGGENNLPANGALAEAVS